MRHETVTAENTGLDFKAAGYLVSIGSVLLLGAVAWPGPQDPGWVKPVLIAGMATSMIGMLLRYIAHLKDASASTRLVSASDKLHNAQAIVHNLREDGEGVWGRFQAGKEGALWYYRTLVRAFREHGSSPLIDELDRVVSEMERLAG